MHLNPEYAFARCSSHKPRLWVVGSMSTVLSVESMDYGSIFGRLGKVPF